MRATQLMTMKEREVSESYSLTKKDTEMKHASLVLMLLLCCATVSIAQNAGVLPASPLLPGQTMTSHSSHTFSKAGSPVVTPTGYPAGFTNSYMLGVTYLLGAQSSTDAGWDWVMTAPP